MVDNGSPDSCPAICDSYAESDNRVIIIHKKNGGLSDARNVGIAIAKGDFICLLIVMTMCLKIFCNGNTLLRKYAERRLSFELEKWIPLCKENSEANSKYEELCKQAHFLLYEKCAWEGYSFKAKLYYKLRMICPKFADKLQKLKNWS